METLKSITDRIRQDFPNVDLMAATGSRKTILVEMPGDPNCPICHGIGFVAHNVSIDDPLFGKMEPCVCRLQKVSERMDLARLEQSNLSGYQAMTFDSFTTEGRGGLTQDQMTALKYAKSQALKFAAAPKGWLLFSGSYGAGKTHLAAAIANSALEKGISNIFQPVPDLLDELRGGYGNYEDNYENRLNRIRGVELLILDDLGTQNATPWAEEKLYQIINYRYVNRLATVITTNNDLHVIDGRIVSRLMDPMVLRVHMQVPDYRDPLSSGQNGNDLSILHLFEEKLFSNFYQRRGENLSEVAYSQLENALRRSLSFSEDPNGWLVLAGPPGIGKTHLAAAIGNQRKLQMESPLMIGASDLLDHLRATYGPNAPTAYDALFEQVRGTPLLILLNLDTMNATPWAREKMYQIINYRYQAQIPTVITLTKPIMETDPVIRARLLDQRFTHIVQMFDVPMFGCDPSFFGKKNSLPGRMKKYQ